MLNLIMIGCSNSPLANRLPFPSHKRSSNKIFTRMTVKRNSQSDWRKSLRLLNNNFAISNFPPTYFHLIILVLGTKYLQKDIFYCAVLSMPLKTTKHPKSKENFFFRISTLPVLSISCFLFCRSGASSSSSSSSVKRWLRLCFLPAKSDSLSLSSLLSSALNGGGANKLGAGPEIKE